MTIKKVEIDGFRNIDKLVVEPSKNGCLIVGKNRLGKTNILNAIAWCLTGKDIYCSSDNGKNVPFDRCDAEEGELLTKVRVELENNAVIERKLIQSGRTQTQKLIVNNFESNLKEGEKQIATVLGTSDVAFLINPLYFDRLEPKDMRKFIIKTLNVDTEQVYSSLPKVVKSILNNSDFDKVNADTNDSIKATKKEVEYWSNVLDFLKRSNEENSPFYQTATANLNSAKTKLADLNDKKIAVGKYAKELTKAYDRAVKEHFTGIRIDLLEYNADNSDTNESFSDCCKIYSKLTKTEMKYCSTSEKIITGIQFIVEYAKVQDLPKLPILVDEKETIDESSELLLGKIKRQLIQTCVASNEQLTIKEL